MARFERTLVPSLRAPYEARLWLKQLGMPLQPERADAARLVISELVTSSVKHCGSSGADEIQVVLRAENGVVRVEVTDPELPASVGGKVDDVSEWSFRLIDKLSDRWGILEGEPRRLWCEMDVYRV